MLSEMEEQVTEEHEIDYNKTQMLEENNIDIRDLSVCINNVIYCNICNNFTIKPPTIPRIKQHLNSHKHIVYRLHKDYEEELREKEEELESDKAYYNEFLEQQEEELRTIMEANLKEKDDEMKDQEEQFINIIEEKDKYIEEKDKYIEELEKQLNDLKPAIHRNDTIIKNNNIALERKNELLSEHKIVNIKNDKLIKELYNKINLLEYSKKYSNKKYSFA